MKRLLLIIIFITVQIAVSIITGYAVLDRTVPDGTVGGVSPYFGVEYSGTDIRAAAAVIESVSENQIQQTKAAIIYRDTEFLFDYSEIVLTADYSRLVTDLLLKKSPYYPNSLYTAFSRGYESAAGPVYSADADAFYAKLSQIKTHIDVAPVNADINCSPEGVISLEASSDGVLFDIDRHFTAIYNAFLSSPFRPLILASDAQSPGTGLRVVSVVEPRISDDLLAGIDTVLARIDAPVPAGYDMDLAANAAEAINKVWTPKKGAAYAPFSFMRYIEEAGLSAHAPAREYDFVASALMHALLAAGEDYTYMETNVSDEQDKYPGLPGSSVELTPDTDFFFTNILDGNIIIFASVADGTLRIMIAGNAGLSPAA